MSRPILLRFPDTTAASRSACQRSRVPVLSLLRLLPHPGGVRNGMTMDAPIWIVRCAMPASMISKATDGVCEWRGVLAPRSRAFLLPADKPETIGLSARDKPGQPEIPQRSPNHLLGGPGLEMQALHAASLMKERYELCTQRAR